MISQWVREAMEIGQIEERIIIYSDGSQSEKGYNGAGIFLTNSSFTDQESQAWNLGTECEVYDAELFAIYKALQISYKKLKLGSQILDIWIFSDSQSAIQRLKDSLKKLNLALYEKIYKKIQKIRKRPLIFISIGSQDTWEYMVMKKLMRQQNMEQNGQNFVQN